MPVLTSTALQMIDKWEPPRRRLLRVYDFTEPRQAILLPTGLSKTSGTLVCLSRMSY